MNKKTIGGLYYRELGEASKLRRINNQAKENKLNNKLNIACEYLNDLLKNPTYINNYELKLAQKKARGY